MAPTVSVVIPAFNRAATVCPAIASVLAQTFQDFEIIVVDDGSTDATPAVVEALADPRITLIRHARNRGASAARNTGIAVSRGPYIAFLDSDDEWLPAKLERQLDVFGRASPRVGLVAGGVECFFADGTVSRHIPHRFADLPRALLTKNVVGPTSVGMVRRGALQAAGGFDESLPASQDRDLWVRICQRFEADFVPDVLARLAMEGVRISSDIVATTRARELFGRKYHDQLVSQGVWHRHLRGSGWLYQRKARDSAQARRCYLMALADAPLAPMTYGLLLMASLPASWQDWLVEWKHSLTERPRLHWKHVTERTCAHDARSSADMQEARRA
ncbi:MAG: glycosyltransferase family 2 protein [Acidobacteriota bacterium]